MRSFLLLIFLLFVFVAAHASEKPVVKCEGPVNAAVGENVTFPCSLQPPYNMRPARVEWTRNTTLVHRYRSGKDDNGDQDEKYKGRTFMFQTELDKGNISLKLTNVTVNDAGHYTCRVPTLYSEGYIDLSVYLSVDPGDNSRRKGTDPPTTTKGETLTTPAKISIGVIIPIIVIIAIVGVIIYWKKCKGTGQGPDPGQGQDPHNEFQRVPQEDIALQERGGGGPGLRQDQTEQTPAPATPEFNSNGVKKQSKH